MILFTIYGLFTEMLYDGDGRKNPKYKLLPTPVNEVEGDCFPVSENTENKLDWTYPKWERFPNLMGRGMGSWWQVI